MWTEIGHDDMKSLSYSGTRGSSVSIVTDGQDNRASIPDRGRDFSLFAIASRPALVSHSLL